MDRKSGMLVHLALLTALCAVATMVIPIPTVTGGYLNAGDIIIVMTALLAGPFYAATAGSIGSAAADLLSGYTIFAPASFIAKGLSGFLIGWIWRRYAKKSTPKALFASLCGELTIAACYFLYEAWVLGFGWGAAAEIPANLLQGAVGTVGGIALYHALYRVPPIRSYSDQLIYGSKKPRP